MPDTPLTDLQLLERLVAIPSVSQRDNSEIVDLIASFVQDDPHARVERLPLGDGREGSNLICTKGPPTNESRDGLVLSGHLDVVPAQPHGWTSDAFTLTRRDEKVYGRGSCDMKAFIAIATNRFRAIPASTLRRPLALVFSHDEEVGSVGAQALASTHNERLKQELPRHAVIGEPTSLRVVRMHKGHLKARYTIEGTAAHSGFPHLGRNAIERALPLLDALTNLRRELETHTEPTSEHFPEVPYPALNIARIAGGVAINVVPASCSIDVGVRLLPGMNTAHAIQTLSSLADTSEHVSFELINDNPPFLESDSSPIVREAMRIRNQTNTVGVSFASDAGVLKRDLAMECILFGPGSITVAHRPDEWLPLDEFAQAGNVTDDLIHRFCVAEQAV